MPVDRKRFSSCPIERTLAVLSGGSASGVPRGRRGCQQEARFSKSIALPLSRRGSEMLRVVIHGIHRHCCSPILVQGFARVGIHVEAREVAARNVPRGCGVRA